MGVGRCTPLPGLYGDLQWTSPFVRHQVAAVRYWLRLAKMPDNRLTKRTFNWDYQLALRGKRSWNLDIKKILRKCGYETVFADISQRIPAQSFTNDILLALSTQERNSRDHESLTMSRTDLYRQLRASDACHSTDSSGALYINGNLSRHERSVLAKLRGGMLTCLRDWQVPEYPHTLETLPQLRQRRYRN